MKILDATAGHRTIWYQKNHPFVTFLDKRKGNDYYIPDDKNKRPIRWKFKPDVVADWTKHIPFDDNEFDVVIFNPPHKIETRGIKLSNLDVEYGFFYKDNWKKELKNGIKECFRVLKPKGIFILKWNEVDKPIDEVLSLFPYPPLVGTKTGQRTETHWIMFLKYDVNMKLTELQT